MPEQNERPRPHGDPLEEEVVGNNTEENQAQRQSDAPADVVGNERSENPSEQSDRANGAGSDANGIPAFDEADGERRKQLYKDGATLVSRMD